ncbi:MAG TPA: YibE/F family protein [Firmicutes bacterium]|jgi:uncharacterized membrane protein|nr:YibE/F family protein [Bacillota bacterium]
MTVQSFWNHKKTWLIIIHVSLAILFAVFLFFFNQVNKVDLVNTQGRTFEKAKVVAIVRDNLAEDGKRYGNQVLKLQMVTGKLKGQIVDATSDSGYLFGAACRKGMKVVTITSISGNLSVSSVYSSDRETVIYVFVALFLLILWLVGGKKGFTSALGLIFTFICIIFLYLPMIYKGYSPFFAAAVVVILTTIVAIYLIGGYTVKSLAAILGTVSGVIIAGIFAATFGYFAGISGLNVSDIESLLFVGQMTHIQIGGLLFSGILIASLGAVMDIGISVASAMSELYLHTPALTKKQLFAAGVNVGRDITGTMANTLILAYTGGSLSILILNYAYNLPYLQVINSYSIGIEIIQGISGSLGVVLAAPLVSLIASQLIPLQKQNECQAPG